MLRQTILALCALAATAPQCRAAASKPVTFDCQLDRKVILNLKVRSQDRAPETVAIDLVGKTLTVGKRTGKYATLKFNEATMVGLPAGQRVVFNIGDGTLSTTETSEFGEVVMRNGKCVARK